MTPRRAFWVAWWLVLLLVPADLAQAQAFTPPPGYTVLWDAVKACSQATDTTGVYGRIQWVEGTRTTPTGEPVLAEWFPPDTIYLSDRAKGEAWVIAHELLHALLGPTSLSHPADPFLFPCKLMDFQQPGRVFMSPRERA